MGTVFGKNKTSSSITVAGHKVYYIDSTDAEIVEVEKTSGQALPSVGDTVNFGNYPQATNTPEPIEWTVLAVDSVNGKALLIAKLVLDCRNFNSGNTNTTWETCSLRTWLNNTFLETAFNSTERGRILTTHIETPNNPSYPSISGGNATDDKVFLLSIQEANDTSYFENAAARKTLATQIAISNGIYEESGYAYWMLRSLGADGKSVADVLPDGGLSYSGLSTYSAPGNGIRPAFWFGLPPAIRRNAFKYTLSGTPYYYVVDGEHDTWTDDLSAWGYSEVPVGPVLPEVKQVKASGNGWGYLVSNLSDTSVSIANNEKASLYFTANTNVWGSSSLPYSVGMLQSPSGTDIGTQGVIIDTSENVVKCKNVSGSSLSITRMTVYYCNDSTATIITVYNSSNVAYNAFKFTASGTDYYYVLDETQTDWTDNLLSIGYSLTPVVVLPTVSDQIWCSFTDRAQNHYKTVSADAVARVYNASQAFDPFWYDVNLVYAIKRLYYRYSDTSGVEMPMVNDSGYLAAQNTTGSEIQVQGCYFVTCSDSTATVVTVYNSSNVAYNAFKFTANNIDYYYVLDGTQTDWTDDLAGIGYSLTPETVVAYPDSNKAAISMQSGNTTYLKDSSGYALEYDSTKTYSAYKYYSSASDTTGTDATGIKIGYLSGWTYLMLTNNTGRTIVIQRIEYIVS